MKPDWKVDVVDGQPEMLVNAAAIARMALHSPIGVVAAMDRLRQAMPTADFQKIETELRLIADSMPPMVPGYLRAVPDR